MGEQFFGASIENEVNYFGLPFRFLFKNVFKHYDYKSVARPEPGH